MNIPITTPYMYISKTKSDYTSRDHKNQIKNCKNHILVNSFFILRNGYTNFRHKKIQVDSIDLEKL